MPMQSGSESTSRADAAPPVLVLANLGTPTAPTAAAVAAYLDEFLSDPRVVQLPRWLWRPLLRKVILLIPLILLLPRLGIFENAAFAVFLAEPAADTLAVCTTAAMFFTRFGNLTAGAENA